MLEFLRNAAMPSLLTERMNEIAARGWSITNIALAARDQNNRPDLFQIDGTRDATLYVEHPGGALHRDDLFYRLSRLDPESRGALIGYLAQLESNRNITDAPPNAPTAAPPAEAFAASAPPPPSPGAKPPPSPEAIADATDGTVVPNDKEALTLAQREAPVECPACEGEGAVSVEPDPDDGIEVDSVPCPCCNGICTVSRRVADQFDSLVGRYQERARQTARSITKSQARLAQLKADAAAAEAEAEAAAADPSNDGGEAQPDADSTPDDETQPEG